MRSPRCRRDKTRRLPFRLARGDTRYVEMMQQDGVALGYYNAPEMSCQVLELPYAGDQVCLGTGLCVK